MEKATAIILRGGPGDGEIHQEAGAGCTAFRRLAPAPDGRYLDSGSVDRHGRRIFEHSPDGQDGLR